MVPPADVVLPAEVVPPDDGVPMVGGDTVDLIALWDAGPAASEPAGAEEAVRDRCAGLCARLDAQASAHQIAEQWADRLRRARLEDEWANREWEAAGLPITFHHNTTMDDVEACVDDLASNAHGFYIGGTEDPVRRWLGDAGDGYSRPMVGHHATYSALHVVALEGDGGAGEVEARLIKRMKERYKPKCRNKALDSRGLSKSGFGFIYVCVL
jgi:hypothetical protein